ncbi:Zinc finger protein 60 [Escovopsis weberi]|uniref:Zinc finger protein 60 n=1 Tax=Escovopsis weberi TaxID=150374 RepID=A0A0M9VRS2_ESCWE|nr:Zinc finger protein 60 [Escovopsis weberi]
MSRTTSWGRKATPSINEALVSMGQNFASIGAGCHTRSGSVSNLPPAVPSKGSLSGLSVKNPIRRPRSKSDLPKPSGQGEIQSKLADLWWKSGGPPGVSMISRAQAEPDEEEDEEDESFEEHDMKMDPNLINGIAPTVAGFQSHILALNPSLSPQSYLVERISRQQVDRFKQLLTSRLRHLGLGVEGAITQESFPADIPLPPTQRLPAEFECQLCFQQKKLHKPSDWTKHVHEDVQPFTCTWEKCRDPKMFKRKADWVRHENEGHRQLEWWACDVDDCRHVCYRRDNFLQHLVREHKFAEPKVKNKAALKKAISVDATWKKVEQCHRETDRRPQDEPCKFCGRVFPTWKKLTVHLAKHMEKIALPVLRLVSAKARDLDADTVISPIPDGPSRQETQRPGEQNLSASAAGSTSTGTDVFSLDAAV